MDGSIFSNKLQTGDILVFQKTPNQKTEKFPFPRVVDWFDRFFTITNVRFKPIIHPKEEGFTLELTVKDTPETIKATLARHLKIENPACIKLTAPGKDGNPIKKRAEECLQPPLLSPDRKQLNIIFFQILPLDLSTLDLNIPEFRVYFRDVYKKIQQNQASFYYRRGDLVSDLLKSIKATLIDSINKNIQYFRLIGTKRSRCEFCFNSTDINRHEIEDLEEELEWIVEEIPEDQRKPNTRLIVVGFLKEGRRLTQKPFHLKFIKGEKILALSERIKVMLKYDQKVKVIRIMNGRTMKEDSDSEKVHWKFMERGDFYVIEKQERSRS